MLSTECDILVIGGGNAGYSAAISAAQACTTNKRIILIDKCPESWAGGNTYFTAGAFRTVHSGLADLLPLVNNVDDAKASKIDIPPYPASEFAHDLHRMTSGRADRALSQALVSESNDAVKWLAANGVPFQLSFNRQAYEVDGRIRFWGGMALKTEDGGKGLMQAHMAKAGELGVEVYYSTTAKRLHLDPETGAVVSVSVIIHDGEEKEIRAKATILTAGGFEANPSLRAKHLGPNWASAFVRGSPYNTGEVLVSAIRDATAQQAGDWAGCHCVAWDANAPRDAGDRGVSNEFTKSGYPLGIMVNCVGERFVDEGSDLRNYTYAMVGRKILGQPGGVAFQVWDAKTTSWLREEEYRREIVEWICADSIAGLAEECALRGLEDKSRFIDTITRFNHAAAHNRSRDWNPAVKDGLSTCGVEIPKSNWALPIDSPPFLAVKVSAGITFTFGGLAVNPDTAAVVSARTGAEIAGLYCAGEMLGGIFYGNYPGGSGLTAGTVFGRRAGRHAVRAIEVASGDKA